MSDEQQRFPIRRPRREPVAGALNIARDVYLARQAYGANPPTLQPSIDKARHALSTMNQSQLGDNVEELDNRLIDVLVACHIALEKLRGSFPELTVRHAA